MEETQAWSAPGDGRGAGVLVSHGFTGNPSSVRGLAEAFAHAGFTVELPRLPGHGTTIEDMLTTTWDDWSGHLEAAYRDLADRCERVVVAGLSMGGTLAGWLATRHPDIRGIVAVNGFFDPPAPSFVEMLDGLLEAGVETMDGIGSDVARPDVEEDAYAQNPVGPLRSLALAIAELHADLPAITCPSLVMTSPQDHVVPPVSSDVFADRVSGPVERITLERSFHVATLDWDAPLVEERAVEFAVKVTAG